MTCSHGREGLCLDDETPAARAVFELAHRMAFAWAAASGVSPDLAERFAGAYAAAEYGDDLEAWDSFPPAYEAWAKAEGVWITGRAA